MSHRQKRGNGWRNAALLISGTGPLSTSFLIKTINSYPGPRSRARLSRHLKLHINRPHCQRIRSKAATVRKRQSRKNLARIIAQSIQAVACVNIPGIQVIAFFWRGHMRIEKRGGNGEAEKTRMTQILFTRKLCNTFGASTQNRSHQK